MWDGWVKEYKKCQSDHLEGQSLPKLDKPFVCWSKLKTEEKAAEEGTSSLAGIAAAGKLLKQAKKKPSPLTPKP